MVSNLGPPQFCSGACGGVFDQSVAAARHHTGAFADKSNRVFLEFVRAERLIGDAPPEGFWFEDLFRLGVLGLNRPWVRWKK